MARVAALSPEDLGIRPIHAFQAPSLSETQFPLPASLLCCSHRDFPRKPGPLSGLPWRLLSPSG